MAWESVILKIPGFKRSARLDKNSWVCPKCAGKEFTLPYRSDRQTQVTPKKSREDEKEFLVLICDRCGELVAFEGCMGDCAGYPKSRCEVCGRYYCVHCGISLDIETEEGLVELRYCNDHIPEWYQNR